MPTKFVNLQLEDFSLPAVADLEKEMNMNEFNDARITVGHPLRGRVAWETGLSQGIGRTVANEFARLGARDA